MWDVFMCFWVVCSCSVLVRTKNKPLCKKQTYTKNNKPFLKKTSPGSTTSMWHASVSRVPFTTYKIWEHVSLQYTCVKQRLSSSFIFLRTVENLRMNVFCLKSSSCVLLNLSKLPSSPYNNSPGYSTAYHRVELRLLHILQQLSATNYRKLFSVVTLWQFLSLG